MLIPKLFASESPSGIFLKWIAASNLIPSLCGINCLSIDVTVIGADLNPIVEELKVSLVLHVFSSSKFGFTHTWGVNCMEQEYWDFTIIVEVKSPTALSYTLSWK